MNMVRNLTFFRTSNMDMTSPRTHPAMAHPLNDALWRLLTGVEIFENVPTKILAELKYRQTGGDGAEIVQGYQQPEAPEIGLPDSSQLEEAHHERHKQTHADACEETGKLYLLGQHPQGS